MFYFLVVSPILSCFGLFFNILVAVFSLFPGKLNLLDYRWFILDLAIFDGLVCFICGTLQTYFASISQNTTNSDIFDTELCKFTAFVFYISIISSTFFRPLVPFNRYVSLYHAGRYKSIFRQRNIFLISSGIITLAVLVFMEDFLSGSLGRNPFGVCGRISELTRVLSYFVVNTPVLILVILTYILLIFFNVKIHRKLREHRETLITRNFSLKELETIQQLLKASILQAFLPPLLQIPVIIMGKLARHVEIKGIL